LEKELKIFNARDPVLLEKSNLIKNTFIEISKKYLHSEKKFRNACPACGHDEFNFAFNKDTFHYVQCDNCFSLYLFNFPGPAVYNEYANAIDRDIYSSEVYLEYMKADSENILYDIELSLSRFFDLKQSITVGFTGNKNVPIFNGNKGLFKNAELIEFSRDKSYDVIIVNNEIESVIDVDTFLNKISNITHPGGFVYLTARNGSGLDILTLWEDSSIIPLQHINLFSIEGYKSLLARYFEIIDLSTPGSFDFRNIVNSVSQNIPRFINYIISNRNEKTFEDFQNFVQKNMLSSYLVTILKKRNR